MPTYNDLAIGGSAAVTRDRTRAVFGHVMGLVALTAGCTALGAYVSRNMTGSAGLPVFIGVFACVIGLNWASRRGREQLAVVLLFGMGLLLGIAVGPVLNYYAKAQPDALYQAAGCTALFVAALGTAGYATRQDLSRYYRVLFFALLALIVFGIVGLLVAIPGGNIIYCVIGLVVFGGFTVLDFNRLKRTNMNGAVPIAAGIFLDIFNVFLLLLSLFGGGGNRR
jgi:FtsH-binding integral membrane protein